MFGFNYYHPIREAVLGIKSTFDRFPNLRGLSGTHTVLSTLGLRFDTRPARENSTYGVLIDLAAGGVLSQVSKSKHYGIIRAETKFLWDETSRIYGAARALWSYVYGAGIPFYERQSYGGSFIGRGFILDRFVDSGLWTIDFEQRITTAVLHVEGSTLHVRVDPFVTVGQVYRKAADFFDRIQITEGIGFRAFSPPNVMARIDIARDESEFNVYVELGYPF